MIYYICVPIAAVVACVLSLEVLRTAVYYYYGEWSDEYEDLERVVDKLANDPLGWIFKK